MRRKEKEITDNNILEEILKHGEICRLALVDHGIPYIVPVNYGYESGALFFHSAREGRKIDILKSNNQVCFEIETDVEIIRNSTACNWGMKYKSIIGYGKVEWIESNEEKIEGLNILMRQYSPENDFTYHSGALDNVLVFKIIIDKLSGKQSGY
mgnify:FL=1